MTTAINAENLSSLVVGTIVFLISAYFLRRRKRKYFRKKIVTVAVESFAIAEIATFLPASVYFYLTGTFPPGYDLTILGLFFILAPLMALIVLADSLWKEIR